MATKWYTLTVRVGIEEPINPPGDGSINNIGAPAFAVGQGIRDALGLKGQLLIDEMCLIPEDERRGR